MDDQQRKVTAYCGAFVDELSRAGVQHAVISPGSRSTPLAMLTDAHPHIRVWLHVDERSAAFFALGLAKAKQEPVALLCTSGTAAANYYPAIVEAKLGRVPLVVLTSDRPHELRDVGAPQTIDQIGMYGSHVKWFVEMAPPESSREMLKYVRQVAARAVATAKAGPNGPVHLNFPFREPFIPDVEAPGIWDGGRESRQSSIAVSHGRRALLERQLEALARDLQRVERGLIVCGPQDSQAFPREVTALAKTLQFPVLADPLSQVRHGPHDQMFVVDGYDAFLREPRVVEALQPEVVIRFGAVPVSKALSLYLKKHSPCRQIVVESDGGWRDPLLSVSEMIYADTVWFCRQMTEYVRLRGQTAQSRWIEDWIDLNRVTQRVVREQVSNDEMFEGRVFLELAELLPSEAGLFVGNSMPVRDLDTFFMKSDKAVRTMANRGANGIDGVVSSALGASVAYAPLVLVVGDLSFFHDQNGLLPAKLYALDATIVLLNNDGGGIFSFLPQAKHESQFEKLFGTPLGLDYRYTVEMFGGTYILAECWDAFRQGVKEGLQTKGLTVVEVRTNRARNAERHRSIWQGVAERVRAFVARECQSCASR